MAVFMLLMAGVMLTQIMGMKMYSMSSAKLVANMECRKTVARMNSEIRAATSLSVGTGNATTFTPIAVGSAMQGTALQIGLNPAGATPWVRYYLDTTAQKMYRVTDTAATPTLTAEYITNTVPFNLEDYTGINVLTTTNGTGILLHLKLQFFQIQYPITKIGPDSLYDYYQVNTRISPRQQL